MGASPKRDQFEQYFLTENLMKNLLKAVLLGNERHEFDVLIQHLEQTGRHYFLRNEILQVFSQLCEELTKPKYFYHSSILGEIIQVTHEILIDEHNLWFLIRPSVAQQLIFRINPHTNEYTEMQSAELLNCRDRIVNCEDKNTFEINLEPFFHKDLTIRDPRNIGQGFKFLHQFLVNTHANDIKKWEETLFQIIHQCRYEEHSFLIGPDIHNCAQLKSTFASAYECLKKYQEGDCASLILNEFRAIGLEAGWGNTIGRCRDTLKLLERLIQCPDACNLEAFLSKIPNLFSVVSISVHGWVGQDNVLGKAETAGQVAYVLDQARALEKKLIETIELAGLKHLDINPEVVILTRLIPNCEGTQCNTKLEALKGTQFSKILRVPFRDSAHEMVQDWLSKFQVWPYLEKFADEAGTELNQLFRGRKPDLILGHYSDGNLVAYRMAKRWKTLHCSIAHSLEKTRHLFGDLYWQELEGQYHFSKQFAADLISMNASNFILTSSQHEILGNDDTIGQYESYGCFTLPNLVHVINGVNLQSAKFSIVPPGVDEQVFFHNSHSTKRDRRATERLSSRLFTSTEEGEIGTLENPTRYPIFIFAPVQSGKNLPAILEAFGKHQSLQTHCNLILLTAQNQTDQASNPEQELILRQMHRLIHEYQLKPHMRWIGQRFSSEDLGEIYRIIADRQGVLLHGAQFEAFGLTLLEAMVSGLPVFTTKFGGSAEIISPGKNGFLINPTEMPKAMDQVLAFFKDCERKPELWQSFSRASSHHIQTHYRWSKHVNKVLTLAKIHKYLNQEDQSQEGLNQYLEALYRLIYRKESPWNSSFQQSGIRSSTQSNQSEETTPSST